MNNNFYNGKYTLICEDPTGIDIPLNFDVYIGENIPSGKKSIALKVTIQSDFKTLNEKDLNEISQKIISNVEEKASAKLRS